MTTPPFIATDDVSLLTGYRQKSRQIDQLRKMGVPFRINARGIPVVARSAVDGVRPVPGTEIPAWEPRVLKRA